MSNDNIEKELEELNSKGEVVGKIPAEDYWKWRLTIEELNHADSKAKFLALECKNKELELAKGKLELLLMQQRYQEKGVKKIDESKQEYERVKSEIEASGDFSLKDCVIDPFTYQVIKPNK